MHTKQPHWLEITLGLFLVVLFGIALFKGWTAPMSWDEQQYYVRPILAYANRLPYISLDPPQTAPPTGLIIQAITFRLCNESWTSLRVLSTLATAATAIILFLHIRRDGRARQQATQLLTIVAYPFVLYPAFVFKQHALAILFLVSGLVTWERAIGHRTPRRLVVFSSLLLSLAITTNPLVAPVCGVLALEAWRTRQEGSTTERLLLVSAAVFPIVVLGSLFLLWHGTIPPAYRENEVIKAVQFGTWHPAQLIVCFLTLGVWVAPSVGLQWASVIRSAFLGIPFAIALYLRRDSPADHDFFRTIVGPVSTMIRFVGARSQIIAALLGGFAGGLGVDFMIRARSAGQRFMRVDMLVIAYGAAMLVVPYLFESYYTVLFVAASLAIGRSTDKAVSPRAAMLHTAAVTALGLIYTISHL